MKLLKSIILSLIFAVFVGVTMASAMAVPVLPVIGGLFATSFIPTGATGVAFAGLNKEVWTGELVKRFNHTGTFLDGVPDYSRYVGNEVIHLVAVGVNPNVLVNNTSYPLPVASRADADIPISLDKLETEATVITKDEVYALSYNKMKSVHEGHRESLQEKSLDLAIYNFAPASDGAKTPVVKTTGNDNGAGYKMCTPAEIRKLKRKFDDQNIPKKGRRLVLCNQHIEDLLAVDEKFASQYMNIRDGQILKLYGFEIFEYSEMPLYDNTFSKKAFGSAPAGTDRDASVAFYVKRMFKAKGTMDVDYTPRDARNKREEVSMDIRFIALPKKLEAIGAIVNDNI